MANLVSQLFFVVVIAATCLSCAFFAVWLLCDDDDFGGL